MRCNPIVYHSSRKKFEGCPKIMDGFAIHVGTIGAARSRLRQSKKGSIEARRLFELDIDPARVLETSDCGLWDSAYWIMQSLSTYGQGLSKEIDQGRGLDIVDAFGLKPVYADGTPVPREKWDKFWIKSALREWAPTPAGPEKNRRDVARVRAALLKLGYQAVAYVNRFEAKGSVSFAIIDPGIIKSCREIPLTKRAARA